MDILLLSITVISLVVAFIMSVAAWRLSSNERARSASRVAALAAAASDGPVSAEMHARQAPEPARESHDRLAARPVELPIAREPVAVNDARPIAPWAPARMSSFPSEAQDRRPPRPIAAVVDEPPPSPFGESFLGSAVAKPASAGRQRGLAVAACVLFVALVTGGYWTIYGQASSKEGAADGSSVADTPLELVSMRHERKGPKLAITGLVRNPRAGTAVDRLAAVVFLFDQQSAFITSARADVDFTKLGPGDESPFVVAVDAPANVARYRVSFRNDAGVVPHVDRRGQEPIARELP